MRTVNATCLWRPFAARHHGAMVGVADDDRVLVQVIFLKLVNALLDRFVRVLHGIRVLGVILPDDRQVRMIRIELHLGRIVAGHVNVAVGAALMAVAYVDYG